MYNNPDQFIGIELTLCVLEILSNELSMSQKMFYLMIGLGNKVHSYEGEENIFTNIIFGYVQ